MIRKDLNKTTIHGLRWVDREVSTVELNGSRAEADMIVWALTVLVAERNKLAAQGVETTNPYAQKDGAYFRVGHSDPEELLASIREPNYVEVAQPQVS